MKHLSHFCFLYATHMIEMQRPNISIATIDARMGEQVTLDLCFVSRKPFGTSFVNLCQVTWLGQTIVFLLVKLLAFSTIALPGASCFVPPIKLIVTLLIAAVIAYFHALT